MDSEAVTYIGPIFLGIPALVALFLGGWKLYFLIRQQGLKVNIPKAVLTIETVSSFCKYIKF